MAGGNAAMMSALMGSFADSYGSGNSGGGGLSSALQAMRDPMYEASVKSQMDMDEIEYRAKQEQWVQDKKHEYDAAQAKGLGQVTRQLEEQLGNKPNMSNDEKAYLGMLNTVGQAGLASAIPAVLKMLEQGSGTYAKNFQKTDDMREYEAMQRDPGMEEYMRDINQNALPAAVQVARELVPDWQTNPAAYQQAIKQASKIQKDVGNVEDVAVAQTRGTTQTKEVADTMANFPSAIQQFESTNANLGHTRELIGEVQNTLAKNPHAVAGVAGLASYVPETQAKALFNQIQTVRSNLSMESLKELKRMSATGASGLGATSDKEIALLESRLGYLDTTNDPVELAKTLQDVSDQLGEIMKRAASDMDADTVWLEKHKDAAPMLYERIAGRLAKPAAPAAPAAPSAPSPRDTFNANRGAIQGRNRVDWGSM